MNRYEKSYVDVYFSCDMIVGIISKKFTFFYKNCAVRCSWFMRYGHWRERERGDGRRGYYENRIWGYYETYAGLF